MKSLPNNHFRPISLTIIRLPLNTTHNNHYNDINSSNDTNHCNDINSSNDTKHCNNTNNSGVNEDEYTGNN